MSTIGKYRWRIINTQGSIFLTSLICYARSVQAEISQYDLIIILHSAFGDDINNVENFTSALLDRKCSLAVFIGNEYSDIKEGVLRAADVVHLHSCQVKRLGALLRYRWCECTGDASCLNPKRYYFDPRHMATRNIDFAFRMPFIRTG